MTRATSPRSRRWLGIGALGAAAIVLASCSSNSSPTTTTTTARTTTTTTAAPTTTTTTTTAPEPAAATSLQALGAPAVTAACAGATYTAATPTTPLTTQGNRKFTAGMKLSAGPCTTTFTWHLSGAYASWTSFPLPDITTTGSLPLAFTSGSTPLAFSANGNNVNQVVVGPTGVNISVNMTGVQNFSIVVPNTASETGILDITQEKLTPVG